MKKKIILSSILVIVLCLCVVVGSTFALFTENTKVNIAATAGDLEVEAEILADAAKYKSLNESFELAENLLNDEDRKTHFANGGSASFKDGTLTLDKITPGDAVQFDIKVTNNSDVSVQYTARYEAKFKVYTNEATGEYELVDSVVNKYGEIVTAEMLTVTVNYGTFGNGTVYAVLGAPGDSATFTVEVEFPNNGYNDNKYQGLSVVIDFHVDIVQYNGV